ncbi:MAG: hypothetical protein V9E94_04360 [Microthrixaceae bacterium]
MLSWASRSDAILRPLGAARAQPTGDRRCCGGEHEQAIARSGTGEALEDAGGGDDPVVGVDDPAASGAGVTEPSPDVVPPVRIARRLHRTSRGESRSRFRSGVG